MAFKKNKSARKVRCSVTGRPIQGRVRYWHGRPMCKKAYSHFCKNYKIAQPKPKSFFQRLFG